MDRDGSTTRRGLLAAGVAATVGLAGCVGGPGKSATLAASVSSTFDSAPPVTVPVAVDVYVQNVDSPHVALLGTEVVCYDIDRSELAAKPLGDFVRAEADDANRQREERGGTFTSTTIYSADWRVETTIEVDAVPEWISFRVDEVRFGDDADDGEAASAGIVSASQPPPPFAARLRRFTSERPPSAAVEPGEYTEKYVSSGLPVTDPVLPRPPTVRLWHRRDRPDELEAAVERFTDGSSSRFDVSTAPSDWVRLVEELEADRFDRPHLLDVRHANAVDLAARGLLSDQTDAVGAIEASFVGPAAEAGTVDDRRIGIPYALDTLGLLYDRRVVDSPPETVPALLELAARHHDPDASVPGLDYSLIHPSQYAAWIHAFGGAYYDTASSSLELTEPETIRGVEYVVETLAPYCQDPSRRARPADRAFATGRTPIAIAGPELAARADANGIDVGVATLPRPETAAGSPRPFVRVDMLAFTSRLAEPGARDAIAEATGFAEWYATTAPPEDRDAGTAAPLPAVTDSEIGDITDATAGFTASASTGVLEPPGATRSAIYPPLQEAFEAVLANERSAATALAEAEATIDLDETET